jgi:hypothetical protein
MQFGFVPVVPKHLNIATFSKDLLAIMSRGSSVGIATGYGLDDRVQGFDSRRGLRAPLFSTASRPALRSTQHPIQWVPVVLSPEVKWPGREADHPRPSSVEVKKERSYTFTPISLHGVVLS